MELPFPLTVNERGHLTVGGVDAVELARRFGTPLYVFDEQRIRENCRRYVRALSQLPSGGMAAYATKAFWVGGMALLVAQEGMGADVSSEYELRLALDGGIPAERLVLHGNNKSPAELEMALHRGVGRIVVDSLWELEQLEALAARLGRRARVLVRLVPEVQAGAHRAMQTGHSHSKFGIPVADGQAREAVRRILASPVLEFSGYHVHLGSQILSLEPYRQAAAVVADFAVAMQRELGAPCREVDMGGGLGVRYVAGDEPPSIEELIRTLGEELVGRLRSAGMPAPVLLVEPGRSVVAEAGVTLYTLGAVKRLPDGEELVAVDGGMSDNPRVALYQARYTAVLAARPTADGAALRPVRIVGRLCESGDVICERAMLGPFEPGDVLAVLTSGAYHHPMSSNYNGLPRPAVVAVAEGRAEVWVRRERYEDLTAMDQVLAPAARYSRAAAGAP